VETAGEIQEHEAAPGRGRGWRLAAVGLLAGAAFGMAAAGDIHASIRDKRVAAVAPRPPVAPEAVAPAAAAGDPADPALAEAHGFALAAERGFTRLPDCRSLGAEFRVGCEAYVVDRGAGSGDGPPAQPQRAPLPAVSTR
jgi:hypothetical protein